MLKFLKSLFAPGPAVADDPRPPSPDDPDYHSRLAGLILSEMKLYRGKVLTEARRDPTLLDGLQPDIGRAYEMYVQRTDNTAAAQEIFRDTLVRIFAEDAPLLEPVLHRVLLERASAMSK